MGIVMEEEIKRWTARLKSALILEIIQGKMTVSEARRQFDLPPSEIESWVEDGKRDMENALRAKLEDLRKEVLDQHLFARIDNVREATWWWMIEYNEQRPHDSLGDLTPKEYRQRIAGSSTFEVSA